MRTEPPRWASLALGVAMAVGTTVVCPAATRAQSPSSSDSLRHIQSMVPASGPPGTAVEIYTENLPLQARVHVGVGAIGSGFEALAEARQGEWGEVSAAVKVPDYATWEQPVVFIVFNGIFSPIGISDPFHVTNEQGLVKRRGTISEEGVSCLAMRDQDGFLYTLTGDVEDLAPGDEVVVEGRPVDTGICMQGSTIEVVRRSEDAAIRSGPPGQQVPGRGA